jgi:hypothetical protein
MLRDSINVLSFMSKLLKVYLEIPFLFYLAGTTKHEMNTNIARVHTVVWVLLYRGKSSYWIISFKMTCTFCYESHTFVFLISNF